MVTPAESAALDRGEHEVNVHDLAQRLLDEMTPADLTELRRQFADDPDALLLILKTFCTRAQLRRLADRMSFLARVERGEA